MQPFLFLERVFAYLQGKGYGTATIDQEVRSALKLLGRPPCLVLDIGANKGLWTQSLLGLHPQCVVHAFEPQPACNPILQGMFGTLGNVTLHANAVSNARQTLSLYFDKEGSGLASLSKRELSHHGIDFSKSVEVSTVVIDEFLASAGLGEIDIVKMDVEGHEMAVFQGMQRTLAGPHAPQVIQFEFGGCNIDSRTFFRDFYLLLKDRYHFFRQTPFSLELMTAYVEADECFRTTNFFLKLKTGS